MYFKGRSTGTIYEAGPILDQAGEAAVYRTKGDATKLLKIFFTPPSQKSARKFELLTTFSKKISGAALPLEVLSNPSTNEVLGMVIPFFADAIPLNQLMTQSGRISSGVGPELFQAVRTAKIIAEAMSRLHLAGLVEGDVSDSNFMVRLDASKNPTFAYVIDCNSLQFSQRTKNGNEIYESGVATEAFTAPEIQHTDWSTSKRTVFSDSFGLAVIVWLLVFNRSHPFSVVTPPDEDAEPIGERIAKFQFPFSPRLPLPFGWSPPTLNPGLSVLPGEIKKYLFTCFTDADERNRPTASDWASALRRWEQRLNPSGTYLLLRAFNKEWAMRATEFLAPYRPAIQKIAVATGIILAAILLPNAASLFPERDSVPTNSALFDQPEKGNRPKIERNPNREIFPDELRSSFGLSPEED